MLSKARLLGEALIEAEATLGALFAKATPDAAAISAAAAEIGRIEAALRAAHIETKPVLSCHQRTIYARARGYGTSGHGHHHHSS